MNLSNTYKIKFEFQGILPKFLDKHLLLPFYFRDSFPGKLPLGFKVKL